MKNQFEPALAMGACIIIGCGVIAMAYRTVSGLIGAFLAIAFGGWSLKQAWEIANKD